ncbi:MAG TPA: 4Fe-4S dicluster domain-containing protein [Candidatus Saccharimonadales bacterium]|nr:4Fe-4S dicluster domain-containing protein [Candidatus Saccharimonadales bacterium]
MARKAPVIGSLRSISPEQINVLIEGLSRRGYEVIAPTVRDGAIVYDRIFSAKELPQGYTDEQQAGKYQLKKREDAALFGYSVGPHAWKKFLFPSISCAWTAERVDGHFHIIAGEPDTTKRAFVGVRACELHALAIQDRVFLEGSYVDSAYKTRRQNVVIVAVNCTQAGGTCFCDSMGTGPRVSGGYDILLTEIPGAEEHFLLAESATPIGAEIMAELSTQAATREQIATAVDAVDHAASHMGRTLPTSGLKELLYRNVENPRWDALAERCLSCANCTLVCPTCFCSTIEDCTDLAGQRAERIRKWDSCFTTDFSYIHGGSVRATPRSKFRQWMMHKLAYWNDQFGSSGCTGCGRCITWCPVGIDITEEVRTIRDSEATASISL